MKIAFDTGHTVVGGGDPVELHFLARARPHHAPPPEDVDSLPARKSSPLELTVEQAWNAGLFCPFGAGAVDFAAVLAELAGFDGWAVVER